MPETVLKVSDVHAAYFGDTEILRGVSTYINKGEIVTIIGPNGAGKSTLFRTIFGILKPRKGEIRFQGRDITSLKPNQILRMGISYVFQRDSVFPKLTVQENMEMGGFTLKDSKTLKTRTEELYSMFPILKEKKDVKAQTLSGGQRRMLVMARALMLKPELLLLDEPTAGLAPKIMDRIFQEIKRINKQGVSIMIVEQNARRSLAMSHRAYVLVDGQVMYHGTGPKILDNPEVRRLYMGG